MQTLVTGAGGFIGSHLCADLRGRGMDVRALALPGEDVAHLENLGVEVRTGDLTDPSTIAGVCDGADVVFHLAGRVTDWGPRRAFYSAILDTTANLLEEASGRVGRFVYASSVCACGMGGHLKGQREDDPVRKCGIPYADAKLDAERLVWRYHGEGKVTATVIRPTNVIGPRSVWVVDIVDRFLRGSVPLVDGGRHSASLIWVGSLVDGMVRAATQDVAKGRTYHFRDDWDVTWRRYLTDLGAMVGKKPSYSIPYPLALLAGRVEDTLLTPFGIRPPITRHVVTIMGRNLDIDTTRARTELGWRTKTSYDEAMRRIGEWVEGELAGR